MYRYFTFRLHDVPLPVTTYTKDHPQVRVVAYNVVRDPERPLPEENLYLVRAPTALHREITDLFERHLDVVRRIDCPEPGVLLLHARFQFPARGPLTGFLSVLTQAVGTILEFRPIIIENGNLEVSLISLPRMDSQLRLRALTQYADEKGIGFDLVENRALPQLPVRTPPQTLLDLFEWQVVQTLASSGLYDPDPAADHDPAAFTALLHDLAELLEMAPAELEEVRRAAERKILRAFIEARRENIRLATPPPYLPEAAAPAGPASAAPERTPRDPEP